MSENAIIIILYLQKDKNIRKINKTKTFECLTYKIKRNRGWENRTPTNGQRKVPETLILQGKWGVE